MCFAGLMRSCTIGFSQERLRLCKVFSEDRTGSEQNRFFLCEPDYGGWYDNEGEHSSLMGGIHFYGSTTVCCTIQVIPFALLLVNRQIHDEAESLLYWRNSFYIEG